MFTIFDNINDMLLFQCLGCIQFFKSDIEYIYN